MQVFTFFFHFQASTDFALLSLSPYVPRASQGIYRFFLVYVSHPDVITFLANKDP